MKLFINRSFILSLIAALIIAITIFSILFINISSLNKKIIIKPEVEISNKLNIKENFTDLTSCLIKNQGDMIYCDKILKNQEKPKQEKQIKTHENIIDATNNFILLIYFLFITALTAQLHLLILSFIKKNKLPNKLIFHTSEWAINSPPILGVIGTILSFSLLIYNSKGSSLEGLFNEYFFTAAITTIIGGFIYVFNLFLNICIHSQLK